MEGEKVMAGHGAPSLRSWHSGGRCRSTFFCGQPGLHGKTWSEGKRGTGMVAQIQALAILGRQRQEDHKLEVNPGFKVRSSEL